jgi:hypothetical protein
VRLTIDGFIHIYENIHNAKGLIWKSNVFCKLDRHTKVSDQGETTLSLIIKDNIRQKRSESDIDDNKVELIFSGEDSKVEFSELLRSIYQLAE